MKGRDLDDDLPSFRATDDQDILPGADERLELDSEPLSEIRTPRRPEPASGGNGPLWALCAALSLALIGFAYWSHQQQSQLRQQLVATQNSFARITEDAAGRIQDITGKVTATESSLSSSEQARQEQLSSLQAELTELGKRLDSQNQKLAAQDDTATGFERRLEQQATANASLGEQHAAQIARLDSLEQTLDASAKQVRELQASISGLNTQLESVAQIEQRLTRQAQATQALQERVESLAAQRQEVDLDQELLVLRSELEQRLSGTQDALESIDSFRIQVNRNINTLQTQIRTLQQQMPAP
ncbi:MAG: ATPase [Pseudomonas sp.]